MANVARHITTDETSAPSLNLARGLLALGGFARIVPRQGAEAVDPSRLFSTSRTAAVPRRDDLRKILIIGSGPIVIGQA